jgi:GNAT superfamily N-acetyltransferase
MTFKVVQLKPELAQTFSQYLGSLDFQHAPHWSTCFCRYYYTDCSQEEWQNRTGKQNAIEAVKAIREGKMHGYLAFDGETVIGWCCADNAEKFIRLKTEMTPIIGGKKVGSVICYVIRPEYRGQGVARLLLKAAVDNFRQSGYDAVLTLPVDIRDDLQKRYRGTLHMYQEMGFEKIQEHGALSVMWLDLKA